MMAVGKDEWQKIRQEKHNRKYKLSSDLLAVPSQVKETE